MLIPIDEVVYFDVVTHNPATGAISDADSTPTFDVYEEATDTGLLGATNLTKRTSLTGNYRGTFTASAANGFEAGKWYSVVASATVNSVAGKTVALSLRVTPVETEVTAIKAKTDQLTFTAANKVDSSLQSAGDLVAAVANKIADHVLRRTYANVRASSDGDAISFRSLSGAVAKLVNKWTLSAGTLTVYHEDDATSAGTQTATTNAAAEPITTLDTA